MRSRYAAYRRGDVEYLMVTTDPQGDAAVADVAAWREDLENHCRATRYLGLQILASPEAAGDVGHVRFRVRLMCEKREDAFEELSEFRRIDGRWFYHRGEMVS